MNLLLCVSESVCMKAVRVASVEECLNTDD